MPRGHPDWQPWTSVQRFAGTGGAEIFEQMITTARNANGGTTSTQDIVLAKGFVAHVQIRYPTGSNGLYQIQVFDAATQLWPSKVDSYFIGDNERIDFDCEVDVPLVVADYKLTIHGKNMDDSYPHGALVRIWVVRLPA